MTAQIGEKLIYDGREVSMCSEPLGDYFAFGGNNPSLESNCTALMARLRRHMGNHQ